MCFNLLLHGFLLAQIQHWHYVTVTCLFTKNVASLWKTECTCYKNYRFVNTRARYIYKQQLVTSYSYLHVIYIDSVLATTLCCFAAVARFKVYSTYSFI